VEQELPNVRVPEFLISPPAEAELSENMLADMETVEPQM